MNFTMKQRYAIKQAIIQLIGYQRGCRTNNDWYGLKAIADNIDLPMDENNGTVKLGQATGAQLVRFAFRQMGIKQIQELFDIYNQNRFERDIHRLAKQTALQ